VTRPPIAWVILLGSAAMNFTADYYAKIWFQTNSTQALIVNQVLWITTGMLFLTLLSIEKSMITSATAWSALSLISFAIVGYLTGEPFPARYVLATVLALVAVVLTSY
jgi:hypothetical protein